VGFKEEVIKLKKEKKSHITNLLEAQKKAEGQEMQLRDAQ